MVSTGCSPAHCALGCRDHAAQWEPWENALLVVRADLLLCGSPLDRGPREWKAEWLEGVCVLVFVRVFISHRSLSVQAALLSSGRLATG